MSEKKRSPFVIATYLFTIFIFLLTLLLPTLLSTSWGSSGLLAIINSRIEGSLKAKEIHLSWFGPQTAQGLFFKDPRGNVSIEALHLDSTLWQLLWERRITGRTEIKELNAEIKQADQASATILLRDVNGLLDSSSPFKLSFSGNTQQGETNGEFVIDTEISDVNLKKLSELNYESLELFADMPDFSVKGRVKNFPVALIDQIAVFFQPKAAGLASLFLGEKLNLSVQQKADKQGAFLNVKGQSSTMAMDFNLLISSSGIALANPGKLNFMMTPELTQKSSFPMSFTQPSLAEFSIEHFSIPVIRQKKSFKADFANLSLAAQIKIPSAQLKDPFSAQNLVIRGFSFKVSTDKEQRPILAAMQGVLLYNDYPVNVNVEGQFPKQRTFRQTLNKIADEFTFKGTASGIPLSMVYRFIDHGHPLKSIATKEADVFFTATTEGSPKKVNLALQTGTVSTKLPFIGEAALKNFVLNVGGSSLEKIDIKLSGELTDLAGKSVINDVIGAKAGFEATILASLDSSRKIHFQSLDAQIKSELVKGSLNADFIEGTKLQLSSPAVISYRLTSSAMEAMGMIQNDSNRLSEATPLEFTIFTSQEPIFSQGLNSLKLGGQLKIDKLSFSDKKKGKGTLQNFLVNWDIDAPSNTMTFGFNGRTKANAGVSAGKLEGTMVLRDWLKDDRISHETLTAQLEANISQLPMIILSPLTGGLNLSAVLGSAIDIALKVEMDQEKQGIAFIKVQSPHLDGSAKVKITDKRILLDSSNPAIFSLNLQPAAYSAIRKFFQKDASEITLLAPSLIKAELRELSIPIREKPLPYWTSALTLHVDMDRLHIANSRSRQKILFEGITGKIATPNISDQINFMIHARGNDQALVDFKGKVIHAMTREGKVNKQDLSLQIDGELKHIPAVMFCQFGCLDSSTSKKIKALLGATADATVKASLNHMQGPFYAVLNGQNSRFIIDGNIADHTLTLNQNLEAEIVVTKELGEDVLNDFIPILGGMITATHPIKLTINHEGFTFPLKNFDWNKTHLPQASLELGKIYFANEGQLSKVLSLLNPEKRDHLIVWFSPLYFNLHQGDLQIERVDMLIGEEYPIAAWGKVNFIKDKVNMVIGLSGTAISKAFKTPPINDKYMLQLPLKGSVENASIDKTKASTRIAALVAQSKGTPQGMVIGTVLEIAGGGLSEDKVPPPTTYPLPWSEMASRSEPVDSEPGSPVADMEKNVTKILKKIFR